MLLIRLQVLNESMPVKWSLLYFSLTNCRDTIQIWGLTISSARYSIRCLISILVNVGTGELIDSLTFILYLQRYSKVIIELLVLPRIGIPTSWSSLVGLTWILIAWSATLQYTSLHTFVILFFQLSLLINIHELYCIKFSLQRHVRMLKSYYFLVQFRNFSAVSHQVIYIHLYIGCFCNVQFILCFSKLITHYCVELVRLSVFSLLSFDSSFDCVKFFLCRRRATKAVIYVVH